MKMNEEADATANPPFKIADIRTAIPKHCWVKNPWTSLTYVFGDFFLAFALMALAVYIDSWIFWPLYWTVQGSVFMGLFVLGHDCGHGSFSDSRLLNNVAGHIMMTFVLTPFHGFRIGHRTHHQNHGHADKDEGWAPLAERVYKNLDPSVILLKFTIPFPLFAHPLYLMYRSPGKDGSHFDPNTEIFQPAERSYVYFSTVCWIIMFSLLLLLSIVIGPLQMIKLYWIPYLIFVMWVSGVTYLNHHGHEHKVPWYRGEVQEPSGVLEERMSDMRFFSPDQFGGKSSRIPSSIAKSLGSQYTRRLEAASSQVAVPESSERPIISVLSPGSASRKQSENHVVRTSLRPDPSSAPIEIAVSNTGRSDGSENISIVWSWK